MYNNKICLIEFVCERLLCADTCTFLAVKAANGSSLVFQTVETSWWNRTFSLEQYFYCKHCKELPFAISSPVNNVTCLDDTGCSYAGLKNAVIYVGTSPTPTRKDQEEWFHASHSTALPPYPIYKFISLPLSLSFFRATVHWGLSCCERIDCPNCSWGSFAVATDCRLIGLLPGICQAPVQGPPCSLPPLGRRLTTLRSSHLAASLF